MAVRQAQLSSKVSEAVEAGGKFIEVFYDTVDKRRQVNLGALYLETSFQTQSR